jgi:hypothetical protein
MAARPAQAPWQRRNQHAAERMTFGSLTFAEVNPRLASA